MHFLSFRWLIVYYICNIHVQAKQTSKFMKMVGCMWNKMIPEERKSPMIRKTLVGVTDEGEELLYITKMSKEEESTWKMVARKKLDRFPYKFYEADNCPPIKNDRFFKSPPN